MPDPLRSALSKLLMLQTLRDFILGGIPSACEECGRHDTLMQYATGSKKCFVCPTCSVRWGYPALLPATLPPYCDEPPVLGAVVPAVERRRGRGVPKTRRV